jgi:hypothetical protein
LLSPLRARNIAIVGRAITLEREPSKKNSYKKGCRED